MNVEVSNLTKNYGEQIAVRQINFELKKGEILGFLGPNGAGKSTTMKMMTGYIEPTAGDILYDGQSIKKNQAEIKRNLGYLPENNPLYYDMPIIDYLEYMAQLQAVSKSSINKQVKKMIEICGLFDEKHKKIGELSKGYKQRVGLAQALIHDPELLILDEPTTGLDPNQIIEIRNLIKEIGRFKTIILSTHILPEVEATCDRILIINKGSIVANGTAGELRKQSEGKRIIHVKLEDCDPNISVPTLKNITGVSTVRFGNLENHELILECESGYSIEKEIFKLCVKNNFVLTRLNSEETKLEDIFRNLTLN